MSRRPKGDGAIFQRADGRWIARLTYEDPATGMRKRTQVSGRTKTEASGELKKLRERVDAGKPARDDAAPFGDYASEWVKTTLEVSDRRPSTKALYSRLTRLHIVDTTLGRMPMSKVRPTTVEGFITELRARGLSPSTVRQTYTIGRAIADTAVRDSLIGTNPFRVIKRPKVEAAEAEYLTPKQVEQLLTKAATSRYEPLFRLLVNTGMRRGEALALRWGTDVDLKNDLIHVRGSLSRIDGALVVSGTKTSKSKRDIPISTPAKAVLRSIRKRTAEERLRAGSQWHDSGFVFVTEFGEPCDPRNALRALKVAAGQAELPDIGLHTLRHSAASVMLSNRVPLKVVSEILGHASIAVTADVYGHVSPDVSRDALDVLGSALSSDAGA